MLTLYHAPQSRSSRMIWLLEELGADYDIAYTDVPRMDGSGAPDPKNPHPDKKVPALVHDGALVTESAAIALYLTDLFPEAGIGAKIGDANRGLYLTWLAYYAGVIEPVLTFAFLGLGDHEGLGRTFRGRAEMERRILDGLAANEYIAGPRFSAADILVASIGHWARDMLPKDAAVDAWLEKCGARPAFKAAGLKDAAPVQA